MAKFQGYRSRVGVPLQPAKPALVKSAASKMEAQFPGIKALKADVTLFTTSNECHLDIEGTLGLAHVIMQVGRLQTNAAYGRIDYATVKAWAAANKLVYSHTDRQPDGKDFVSGNNEAYVVVHLVAEEAVAKNVW
jgi:hypothetical protein